VADDVADESDEDNPVLVALKTLAESLADH
jgi:hypothetical protein